MQQLSGQDSMLPNMESFLPPVTEKTYQIGGNALNNRNYGTVISMKVVAFLNAKHYMVFADKIGKTHGHSWQFQAEAKVRVKEESFIKFEDLERNLNGQLSPYQRMVLNDIPPFDMVEPLTENIAVYFFNALYDELLALNVHLYRLTVWENPTKGIEITQKMNRFFSSNDTNPIVLPSALLAYRPNTEVAANLGDEPGSPP